MSIRAVGRALLLGLLVASPALAAGGLEKAWSEPTAVRSTFFVAGMSCRACTMLLDLHFKRTEGVYWARFNYPLRLLTVYHDPRKVPADAVAAVVNKGGELRVVALGSRPASAYAPKRKGALASWKGGSLPASAAPALVAPFAAELDAQLGRTEERVQVEHEILGEAVRNRVLGELARRGGFGDGGRVELPEVVARDFYWPEKAKPLSADEAAEARLLRARVLPGDPASERQRFDRWLLALWREVGLDFRGETAEAGR